MVTFEWFIWYEKQRESLCIFVLYNCLLNWEMHTVHTQDLALLGGRPSRSGRPLVLHSTSYRKPFSTTPGSSWLPQFFWTRPVVRSNIRSLHCNTLDVVSTSTFHSFSFFFLQHSRQDGHSSTVAVLWALPVCRGDPEGRLEAHVWTYEASWPLWAQSQNTHPLLRWICLLMLLSVFTFVYMHAVM